VLVCFFFLPVFRSLPPPPDPDACSSCPIQGPARPSPAPLSENCPFPAGLLLIPFFHFFLGLSPGDCKVEEGSHLIQPWSLGTIVCLAVGYLPAAFFFEFSPTKQMTPRAGEWQSSRPRSDLYCSPVSCLLPQQVFLGLSKVVPVPATNHPHLSTFSGEQTRRILVAVQRIQRSGGLPCLTFPWAHFVPPLFFDDSP